MKIRIDCKYAKVWDSKRIKCRRDGSLRNIIKQPCYYACPHYKAKKFVKLSHRKHWKAEKKNPDFDDVDNLIYNPLRTAAIKYTVL